MNEANTYLTQTGKVVRKSASQEHRQHEAQDPQVPRLVDSGKMTLDSVVQSYASWTGHISHGNTYHLRQNMDAYFFSYFPELKPSPKGDTTHGPKTEQPRKQVEGQVRQPVRQPDRLDRADKNHAGYPSNSVTLVTNQIIKMLCFDATEPSNGNSDRRNYGNNRYIY